MRNLVPVVFALAASAASCLPAEAPKLPQIIQYAETRIYERASERLAKLEEKAEGSKAAKLEKIRELLQLWATWRADPDASPREVAREALHDAAELLGLELIP